MFHVEQYKMFHVKQCKMFHVKQCKINVPRETMHKGSSLGGRGQRWASAAAFRFGRRGFGCSPLLGLLGFGRRSVASLCFAPLRHPQPRHPSRSVCLRPPRFRSAAPLRPPLPSPLPTSATSSRLRCCPLPPKLLPLCIVSRVTFILHCFTWNILHCFT